MNVDTKQLRVIQPKGLDVKITSLPSGRCVDYNEDCHRLGYPPVFCWMHDPSTGWCPFVGSSN